MMLRERLGPEASPCAAVLDSQSVKPSQTTLPPLLPGPAQRLLCRPMDAPGPQLLIPQSRFERCFRIDTGLGRGDNGSPLGD